MRMSWQFLHNQCVDFNRDCRDLSESDDWQLMLQSAVCPAKSIINQNDDLFGSSGIRLQ